MSVVQLLEKENKNLKEKKKPSDVQVWKILTVWAVKNSQSSVTFENECKQLRYYFAN